MINGGQGPPQPASVRLGEMRTADTF